MEPKDIKLYEKVKKSIYKKIPKHSAYRSGLLVQEYKKDLQKNIVRNQQLNVKKVLIKVKRKKIKD